MQSDGAEVLESHTLGSGNRWLHGVRPDKPGSRRPTRLSYPFKGGERKMIESWLGHNRPEEVLAGRQEGCKGKGNTSNVLDKQALVS